MRHSETYRLHERWVLRHSSLIRWIVKSRDDFGDALGCETRYRPIMSTIATSRKTTLKDNRQEEIPYILLLRAQLPSTAVNWTAPSDAESAIDENDYITPECVRLTRTQRELTRRRYLSQHGYIAGSCALAFPFPGGYLSWSSVPMEVRLSVNEILLQTSTTRWKYTYGGDAIRRSSLTMRMRILWSDTRCPPTISANTHRNARVCYIEQDACYSIDTAKVDPGRANTISANSVTNTYDATNSDALHPTPSSDPELLPVVNNYQATRKRANSQLILRYYVDCQPFSPLRWQSGVPMTRTGGPLIPWLLDLEVIFTTNIGVRQCLLTTCARVRKMHAIKTLSFYGSSSELVVNYNLRRLDGNWLLIL